MLDTLGIILAPCEPARARQCFRRRLGGKSLLEWVVRRVTESQRLDGTIVALGDGPEHRPLAELVPPDVPVFVGDARDALGRCVAALEQYPARAVVLVRADAPFVDPVFIDRLVSTAEAHPACDYVGYSARDGRPAILSSLGVFAEWCRAKSLREADRRARHDSDRANVTSLLYSHPEDYRIRLIPAPERLDRDDVRLTIGVEEDWEHAQAIYDALGPDEMSWQRIAGLLDQQPELRQRMAVLNRSAGEG